MSVPAARSVRGSVREYGRHRAGVVGLAILALCAALALGAPLLIAARDLSAVHAPGAPRRPPSVHFPLGTDAYGRSMVAVTIWGARISLLVGLLATAMSVGIGSVTGIVAGHFRGWVST
ncbi:MAG TPA: ABC transporter permease, partial [Actinomycetota bacterium]|nr:ABC transporter permease [Actinomycetota bacterium]